MRDRKTTRAHLELHRRLSQRNGLLVVHTTIVVRMNTYKKNEGVILRDLMCIGKTKVLQREMRKKKKTKVL